MNFLLDKNFLWFVAKFLLLFALLYFGTLAVIGLAAPGKYYSPLIDQYLDYVTWIKYSLMYGTKYLLAIFGIETVFAPNFVVRILNGRGVRIAMSCVGYGVYSFWIAFVLANSGDWKRKATWVMAGLFLLWLINAIRISLFLLATDNDWTMPLGIDHHLWFNIVAYTAIFAMIYFYDRMSREKIEIKKPAIGK